MQNIPPVIKTHRDDNESETQHLLRSVCSPSCRQATWPDDRQPWKLQRRSYSQFDSHTLIVKEVLYFIDTWLSFRFIVWATLIPGLLHRSVIHTHQQRLPSWLQTSSRRSTQCRITSSALFGQQVKVCGEFSPGTNPVFTHHSNSKINAS